MNSENDIKSSSGDLRHENSFYTYPGAEGIDVFYDEGEEHEDETVYDLISRTAEDKKSVAPVLSTYSKSYLFDFVYVGKEQKDEEEEEEEITRPFEDDNFSTSRYDQTRFHVVALTYDERQEIIRKLKDLFSEAKVLMIVNKFLHKNYIDMNRKSPSMANALDRFDECIIFEDTRYQAVLENFAESRYNVDGRITSITAELENLENSCISAESKYAETFENLLWNQLAVAKKNKPAKYAKEIWLAEVEQQLENQRQRALEVAKIRLSHAHLQIKLGKLMATLKKFDSLGPGFSMMDYEYLLKRKDVYSERRDEQRDHIKKLQEKNLTSAAIIRHIDEEADLYSEKVHKNLDNFYNLVNGNKCERSKAVDLAKTKVALSKRMDRLKEQIGLLNYPFLLRKMEHDLRQITKLRKRSVNLQARMSADAQFIAKYRS